MADWRRTPRGTWPCLALLAALLPAASGCGGSTGAYSGPDVVGIRIFMPHATMSSSSPTPCQVIGGRFGPAGEPTVIRFEALSGTPFLGGTSATLATTGVTESDTLVTGVVPPADIPHTVPGPMRANVVLELASGVVYVSAAPLAVFDTLPAPVPPAVTSITPALLLSGTPTCFTVSGARFEPIGAAATVEFVASAGTPFVGMTDTLAVPVVIESATQVSGVLPGDSVIGDGTAFVRVNLPGGDSATSGLAIASVGAERKVNASDGEEFDYFGTDVAIDGDIAVIGARLEDETRPSAGAAYVFVRQGSAWVQEAKLRGTDATSDGDQFGTAVAVSGDTIAVGAPNNDESAANGGAVYVFTRSGTTWTLQQKLVAGDAASGDHLGESVTIAGDRIAAGAPDENNAGGTDAGAVYVFSRAGTTWSQDQKLTSASSADGHHFGQAVALASTTLVVGAPGGDAAYAYAPGGGGWSSEQPLLAPGIGAGDEFGQAVDVAGDRAIVGAPQGDGIVAGSGVAHVFLRSGPTWGHEQALTGTGGAAGDEFGWDVAVDGAFALVGALSAAVVATNAGSAWTFERTPSAPWTAAGPFSASDGASSDRYGQAVALSGCRALVGAHLDNDLGIDSGSAYFK
jgi:hypothetical protein